MNALIAILACVSLSATAAKQRVHRHGSVELKIAVEKRRLLIELEGPAKDLLGFEYKAKKAADIARAKEAKALWQERPPFALPGCQVTQSSWRQRFHSKTHSEILARVHLQCQQDTEKRSLRVSLKEAYPGIGEVHVEVLKSNGQALRHHSGRKNFQLTL